MATHFSHWVRLTDASRHPDLPGRDAHPAVGQWATVIVNYMNQVDWNRH